VSIERLATEVFRKEVAGDHKRAAELAVQLIDHFDARPTRATHVIVGDHAPERRVSHDPGPMPWCDRCQSYHHASATTRTDAVDPSVYQHALDNPREELIPFEPDRCHSGDNALVSECRGASCKAHNRCCWQ
jgi:hypothetical protein